MTKEEIASYRRQYYLKNRDKLLAKAKDSYLQNRDKRMIRMREYNAEHKEEAKKANKQWREEHKEQLLRSKKVYYQHHKEKDLKRRRDAYWRDPVAARERRKKQYYSNKKQNLEYAQRYRNKNKDKVKNSVLNRCFGITLARYQELLQHQNNRCAICGSSDTGRKLVKYFAVDHDHNTGAVRGLLCTKCNCAIGLLQDSPSIARAAADYLDQINLQGRPLLTKEERR